MFHAIVDKFDGFGRTINVRASGSDVACLGTASLYVLRAIDPAHFLYEPEGGGPSGDDGIGYPGPADKWERADNVVRDAVVALRSQPVAVDPGVPVEPADCTEKPARKIRDDLIVLGRRNLSSRPAAQSMCVSRGVGANLSGLLGHALTRMFTRRPSTGSKDDQDDKAPVMGGPSAFVGHQAVSLSSTPAR